MQAAQSAPHKTTKWLNDDYCTIRNSSQGVCCLVCWDARHGCEGGERRYVSNRVNRDLQVFNCQNLTWIDVGKAMLELVILSRLDWIDNVIYDNHTGQFIDSHQNRAIIAYRWRHKESSILKYLARLTRTYLFLWMWPVQKRLRLKDAKILNASIFCSFEYRVLFYKFRNH